MAIEFDLTRISMHDYLQYTKEQSNPLQSPSDFAIRDIVLWTKITTSWDFDGNPSDYLAWMKLSYHDFILIRAAYERHIEGMKDGLTPNDVEQLKQAYLNRMKENLGITPENAK